MFIATQLTQQTTVGGFGWREGVMLLAVLATLIVGVINFFVSRSNNKKTLFVNAITSERVKWIGQLKELLAEYLSLTIYYKDKPFLEEEALTDYFERLIYLKERIKLHLNYIDEKDEEINKLIGVIYKKIFGFYEMRKIMQLEPHDRFESLCPEDKQEYFDQVLRKRVNEESLKKIMLEKDPEVLKSIYTEVMKEANKEIKKEFGYKGRDDLIQCTELLVDKSRIYLKHEWERVKDEVGKGKLIKGSNRKFNKNI
ncbi:hypothetical protein GLV94_19055 [Virgibacillus halodenitrificans]|uniref:hypothetical protein n=1 Tax=Virgibacillus halodenitrificans TaxID=1482 RepID=UPI001370F437|nr:hypothetical protein [Virgibacillus halodenitrificans]MYL47741.1 hypothetical protein [Virgibacillus halodenitrificans]